MCRLALFPVLVLMALFAPVAPASADPYPPSVPTGCHVSVPGVAVGERAVVRVLVTASGNVTATGTVDLTITSGDETTFSKTVRYEGDELRIVGPRLARGQHVASIRFVPDEGPLLGCRDSVRFRVGGQVDPGGDVGGEATLPDTGGPHLLALLLGVGLLATGSGFVGGSRRTGRSAATAARHRAHA